MSARRQLRHVLLELALLDTSVLVLVIGLAVAWAKLHFPTLELLALILVGVGTILCLRVALAVRLKRRSGNLF
ncbi:MAG: hypothetical protein WCB18_01735 [Thermoplasmata archaeon]